MLGLYAVRLPQFLYMFNPQSDTMSGSFLMGVFAAILSTPCTGPLLGATIAWVATQPSAIAFLTLLAMGFGMAFPYVLLTAKPSWLARVPRTGPGSELVKQVMGLLLLAVAAYFIGTAAVGFRA
jgi:thiol:disulfide interchange protein DsbD